MYYIVLLSMQNVAGTNRIRSMISVPEETIDHFKEKDSIESWTDEKRRWVHISLSSWYYNHDVDFKKFSHH